MAASKTELPLDWPELDEWCRRQTAIIGVDMASCDDSSAIWIVDKRKPDDIRWYAVTEQEAAILYGRRPSHIGGDAEQMIDDIDRVELTPKTRLELLQQKVDQRVVEELCGIAFLQEIGKF